MLRRPLATVTALLVLALVGCTAPTVIPPAGPPSDEQPLFASDEEALAAATEAYEEFLAVSSQILQDGGERPERLLPLVSHAVYETELEGFEEVRNSELLVSGSSSLTNSILQQRIPGGAGEGQVIVYVCVDVSGTDVIDDEGNSIIDQERPLELAFEAGFVANQEDQLILDSKTVWETRTVCG